MKFKLKSGLAGWLPAAAAALLTCSPAFAITVSLSAPQTSPQLVGTKVNLQATVGDVADPAQVLYRFDARTINGNFRILRDFSRLTNFDWASLKEDLHVLRVIAEDTLTGERAAAAMTMGLASPGQVSGNPVVLTTDHPLVALYSAPACASGSVLRVRFFAQSEGPPGQTTPFKSCDGSRGVNHFVAGMTQNTSYVMLHEIYNGSTLTQGPTRPFSTGTLSGFSTDFTIVDPADATTSAADRFFLTTYLVPNPDGRQHVATNLDGEAVWTYELPAGTDQADLDRVVRGGTILLIVTEDGQPDQQVMREIDLAGNTIRETSVGAVNRQLAALGRDPIGSFHHDVRRLSNDRTVAITSIERILTDVQGPGDINVIGDGLVVFDSNFNVIWEWNSFEHMDTSRLAINGNTCVNGQGGCPPIFLGEPANDWTHSNSVAFSPADGDLIMSVRHQDWVIKINFDNGTGDGTLVWRLGRDGDFVYNSSDPYPWQSHQHDAQYQGQNLVIYDNGNTRVAESADPENEHSRGQVLQLDEVNMFANLVHNFDLGIYAQAVGSAQILSNGNYFFHSGLTAPEGHFESTEVNTSDGSFSWSIRDEVWSYRGFRLPTMYNQ